MRNCIYVIERNRHGGWAIYGALGVRQYYNFSKEEAIRRYIAECEQTIFVNKEDKDDN